MIGGKMFLKGESLDYNSRPGAEERCRRVLERNIGLAHRVMEDREVPEELRDELLQMMRLQIWETVCLRDDVTKGLLVTKLHHIAYDFMRDAKREERRTEKRERVEEDWYRCRDEGCDLDLFQKLAAFYLKNRMKDRKDEVMMFRLDNPVMTLKDVAKELGHSYSGIGENWKALKKKLREGRSQIDEMTREEAESVLGDRVGYWELVDTARGNDWKRSAVALKKLRAGRYFSKYGSFTSFVDNEVMGNPRVFSRLKAYDAVRSLSEFPEEDKPRIEWHGVLLARLEGEDRVMAWKLALNEAKANDRKDVNGRFLEEIVGIFRRKEKMAV